MIKLVEITSTFEPQRRRESRVPWRTGIRMSDVVALPWPDGRVVKRNGRRVDWNEPVGDSDVVLVFDPPAGPAVPILVQVFVAFLIGNILKSLAPAKKRGDIESPQYAFNGVQSAQGDGNPITKIYGTIRNGGQVLAKWVEAKGRSGSFINILIGYGYGPIYGIAGVRTDTDRDQPRRSMHAGRSDVDLAIPDAMWIGDKKAGVFSNVELQTRMGNAVQLPLRGFEFVCQTIPVDRELKAPEATSTSAIETYVSLTAPSPTDDEAWATWGVAFDIDERDVEHVTALCEYINGLYSQSASTGAQTPWRSSVMLRYRELDSNGDPISTGGAYSDGYARPRAAPIFTDILKPGQSFGFRWPLYDPQTYTLPAFGKLASINFENSFTEAWMQNTSPTIPGEWSAGSPLDEFTCAVWVVLRPNGTTTGDTGSSVDDSKNLKDNPLFSFRKTSTDEGIELCLGTRTFNLDASQSVTRIVPIAKCGNGSAGLEYYEHNIDGATSGTASSMGDVQFRATVHQQNDTPTIDYARLVLTYKADAVNGLDRLRIYAQGELLVEILDNIDIVTPNQGWYIARDDASDATNKRYFKGHLDELVVDHHEWNATEVERDFATTFGKHYDTPTSTMVAVYHFDDSPAVTGNNAVTVDATSNSNDLTLKLNPSGGTASFVRAGSLTSILEIPEAANVLKRARYRVEFLRPTRDCRNGTRFDDIKLAAVVTAFEEEFSMPGEPLLALRVRADEQISGTVQNVTSIVDGLLVDVWSGADTPTPTSVRQFTRNPAWCALDDATNVERGAGQVFTDDALTVQSAAAWASYCDGRVYDGRGLTTFDDVDTDTPIYDLTYDSTLVGGFGGIKVHFRNSTVLKRPPAHWKIGSFVGFRDLPVLGGYTAINITDAVLGTATEALLGFEIVTSEFTGGEWEVVLKYDTASLGDPWADGGFITTTAGVPITATLEGREARFEIGCALDKAEDFWTVHQKICTTGRARPYIDGTRILWAFDAPAEPIDLITMANTRRETYRHQWLGGTDRPNAYDCTFVDDAHDYQQTPVQREDPILQNSTTLGQIRRGSIDMFGVTRRSQVERAIMFQILKNRLQDRSVRYGMSTDSVHHDVSDCVWVAHDLVPIGKSGRILEADTDSSVKLDRTVVLATSTTYRLAVRNSSALADETFEAIEVTSAAGTYAIGAALTLATAFSFIPQKDDVYILCADGEELVVRIESASRSRTMQRDFEAVKYVEEIYDDDALTVDVPLSNK